METGERAARIAQLNDALRQDGKGGRIFMTRGVEARGPAFVNQAIMKMRQFDRFTEDNDPHGEHDFGSFELEGETLFWKIDYYDTNLANASSDPANPSLTIRVLTLMLASEY